MAIDRVHDKRIRDARYLMRDTLGAYKQAVRDRDALIVQLHKAGEYGIENLTRLFHISEEKVRRILGE